MKTISLTAHGNLRSLGQTYAIIMITLALVGVLSACQGNATSNQSSSPTPASPPVSQADGHASADPQVPGPVATYETPIPTPTRPTVLPPGRGPCPIFVAPPPPLTPVSPTELSHSRSFGMWCYAAIRNEYGLWASIGWDHTTVSGIYAYAARNREMATELARKGGKAQVQITFRTYMEGGQLRHWIETHGLQLADATKRNDRDPYSGMRMSLEIHARDLENLPDKPGTHTGEIPGFVDASGSVDAQRLPEMASDPLVFLVDVTSNMVRPDLIAAGIPGAEDVQVQPPASAFESMEDLGLDNFTK